MCGILCFMAILTDDVAVAVGMAGPSPDKRVQRMREMFDACGGILTEDYTYFTGIKKPGEPTLLSKAVRKSERSNARLARARS